MERRLSQSKSVDRKRAELQRAAEERPVSSHFKSHVSQSFGIYIKTFRPDYHLAKALIASIRQVEPEVGITLIPDDDFSGDGLWGEKTLTLNDPLACSLRGYFKKLWVFLGPYERFIYLDADMLALKPLRRLIETVRDADENFFFVCAESKMIKALAERDSGVRESIFEAHIGEAGLLHEFDPNYDWHNAFPFNSGFFATHRDVLPREWLQGVFESAQRFHRDRKLPPLAFSRDGVFMTDQGLLNYAIAKRGVAPTLLVDAFYWGGRRPAEEERIARDEMKHLFVHWAGCPRPNLFDTTPPAGEQWRQAYSSFHRQRDNRWEWIQDLARQSRMHYGKSARATLRKLMGRCSS